jgi:hypothetical protein
MFYFLFKPTLSAFMLNALCTSKFHASSKNSGWKGIKPLYIKNQEIKKQIIKLEM